MISQNVLPICQVSGDQDMPYVTSNGYQLACCMGGFPECRFALYYTNIFGATVASNGSITPLATGISLATGGEYNPKAASMGPITSSYGKTTATVIRRFTARE